VGEAFDDAVVKFGVQGTILGPVEPEYIAAGADAVEEILTTAPDAIIGYNDLTAIGVMTKHAGGSVGQATLSISVPNAQGDLTIDALTESGVHTLNPTPSERPEVWDTITDEFAALVADGCPAPLAIHHGVRLQRILDAVIRSVDTGETVDLTHDAVRSRA